MAQLALTSTCSIGAGAALLRGEPSIRPPRMTISARSSSLISKTSWGRLPRFTLSAGLPAVVTVKDALAIMCPVQMVF